jgi:hypothetical protein
MVVLVRKSVPLTSSEIELTERIKSPGTAERIAVESLVGALPLHASSARALHALVQLGAMQLAEARLEVGYGALAGAASAEDAAHNTAVRPRRRRLSD